MEEFQIVPLSKLAKAFSQDRVLEDIKVMCMEAGQMVRLLKDPVNKWTFVYNVYKQHLSFICGPYALHDIEGLKTGEVYEASLVTLLYQINQAVEESS